jgi:hypothetical protein
MYFGKLGDLRRNAGDFRTRGLLISLTERRLFGSFDRELRRLCLPVTLTHDIARNLVALLFKAELHDSAGSRQLKREIPVFCLSVFNRVLLRRVRPRGSSQLIALLFQDKMSGTRCAITWRQRAGPRAGCVRGDQCCGGECEEKNGLHSASVSELARVPSLEENATNVIQLTALLAPPLLRHRRFPLFAAGQDLLLSPTHLRLHGFELRANDKAHLPSELMRHDGRPRCASILVEDEQITEFVRRAVPVAALKDLEGHEGGIVARSARQFVV